ncbi:uncharacterized protein (DUF1330 family) [Polymorphobacter multimanifer]|uniref:Uncharacterized protein (DUF1330 family) n=1 Tax=Polymorphobacter multimanifer TaxID=1070431 RepID=A0A841L8K7_9SPHN|nr:DUF1330 domain-containing protein [Polymorphobacter multimanifer]MBB6226175.1 uncharacterized protein (DUF1330 family) [Polymorphobacter multimanifer]
MRALMLLFLSAPALSQAPPPSLDPDVCDNKPVIMLVAGDIKDWTRIRAYGAAIRDSGLYDKLGGYYINVPRSIATFEGTPPPEQSMLMVRFPCFAHARTFWYSREYQERLKLLRLDPSAGDFTVTVYPEAAPPPGVSAWWPKLGPIKTATPELAAGVPQIADKPK